MKQTNIWLNYFRPNVFIKSFEDLNPSNLKREGIRMLVCDLDNTLTPHFNKLPNIKAIKFCRAVQEQGIVFVVVSNNTKKRVERFCEVLQPNDFAYNAKKPLTWKVSKMMAKYRCEKDDVLILGDQFITDIWLANRLGCRSILTLPIVSTSSEKNGFFLNLLENFIYKKLQHNNVINDIIDKGSMEASYDIL